jgi:hypothetical protein
MDPLSSRLRRLAPAPAIIAVLGVTACGVSKSANPLSPSVAGPIPGVNITAPTPLQPAVAAQIAVDQQPVTLVVQNASTSGVRPLSYLFEVAADAAFSNKVFSRAGVTPGDGRTSLKLPDPLGTGRMYYWRAQAQDGANSGPYSDAANFGVFTPIVIQAPIPTAPVNNVIVTTTRPQFTFGNAPRSGPVAAISYVIEISTNDSFSAKVAAWTVGEQANQTGLTAPQDLSGSTQYFWHVRAFDPTTIGPWSPTQVFQTSAAPPPVMPPPVSGSPGPPDGIDMSQATIMDSPSNLAGRARTATITSIIFGSGTFSVDFSKRTGPGRWPDVPFGAPGDSLEYTLGMCLNISGHWYCSAALQYWYGRDLAASLAIARDWFYDARWGPMAGHQPSQGELVGIFVGAGNLRNVTDDRGSLVLERSNVVLLPWGQTYASSSLPGAITLSAPRRRR